MSVNISVHGMQAAMAQIKKELDRLGGGKFVTVGIHQGAADPAEGDLTMAALGATLHFGDGGKIPPRPWLDTGIEAGASLIAGTIAQGASANLDLDQILEQVGVVAVGAVQEYMTELQTPPNAPSTIAKKGSANPLIDSGILRASVTYAITTDKPSEGL